MWYRWTKRNNFTHVEYIRLLIVDRKIYSHWMLSVRLLAKCTRSAAGCCFWCVKGLLLSLIDCCCCFQGGSDYRMYQHNARKYWVSSVSLLQLYWLLFVCNGSILLWFHHMCLAVFVSYGVCCFSDMYVSVFSLLVIECILISSLDEHIMISVLCTCLISMKPTAIATMCTTVHAREPSTYWSCGLCYIYTKDIFM